MEDYVVVGAGIVGLATARALLHKRPGSGVVVLEKADDIATAQTGHNSGVIHAGIYYAPGSLKASLCRAGERATKDFCDANDIRYETVGKLVVATDDVESDRRARLGDRAAQDGLGLEPGDAGRLRERGPRGRGRGAPPGGGFAGVRPRRGRRVARRRRRRAPWSRRRCRWAENSSP